MYYLIKITFKRSVLVIIKYLETTRQCHGEHFSSNFSYSSSCFQQLPKRQSYRLQSLSESFDIIDNIKTKMQDEEQIVEFIASKFTPSDYKIQKESAGSPLQTFTSKAIALDNVK